jgi:hypothetical protein
LPCLLSLLPHTPHSSQEVEALALKQPPPRDLQQRHMELLRQLCSSASSDWCCCCCCCCLPHLFSLLPPTPSLTGG